LAARFRESNYFLTKISLETIPVQTSRRWEALGPEVVAYEPVFFIESRFKKPPARLGVWPHEAGKVAARACLEKTGG
jgi:hypothetical protein